jgi:heptosyltransferase III
VTARSILVISPPSLGDSVLIRPVYQSLRAWAPQARIVAATYPEGLPNLDLHPEIDDCIPLPPRAGALRSLAAHWIRLAMRLRREKFDLVYDHLQSDRSAAVILLTRSSTRIGFVSERARLRHRLYQHLVSYPEDEFDLVHTSAANLAPLEAAGIPILTRVPRVPIRSADSDTARMLMHRYCSGTDLPRVVIHPGASVPSKVWPTERFVAVAAEIERQEIAKVLFVGGPAEQQALAVLGREEGGAVRIVQERLSVGELAALFAEADLFLGNDSGPMHLAAAVGTRVLALFGPSSVERWRPLGTGHRVLQAPIPCEHCLLPDLCRPPGVYQMYCIRHLEADRVLQAVRDQLAEPHQGVEDTRSRCNGYPAAPPAERTAPGLL